MKINNFRIYKTDIVVFMAFGLFAIIGSVILTVRFYAGEGIGDFIILFLTVTLGIVIALLPIIMNYRQLTQVHLTQNGCVSYSFLRKQLCHVDFSKKVFYSVFYVRIAYTPKIKFVAVSNEPFECERESEHINKRSFYRKYDQKKIIVFLYDDQLSGFLNTEKWQQVNVLP